MGKITSELVVDAYLESTDDTIRFDNHKKIGIADQLIVKI